MFFISPTIFLSFCCVFSMSACLWLRSEPSPLQLAALVRCWVQWTCIFQNFPSVFASLLVSFFTACFFLLLWFSVPSFSHIKYLPMNCGSTWGFCGSYTATVSCVCWLVPMFAFSSEASVTVFWVHGERSFVFENLAWPPLGTVSLKRRLHLLLLAAPGPAQVQHLFLSIFLTLWVLESPGRQVYTLKVDMQQFLDDKFLGKSFSLSRTQSALDAFPGSPWPLHEYVAETFFSKGRVISVQSWAQLSNFL